MICSAVASIAAVLVSIVNSTSTLAASSPALSAIGKPSASAFSRRAVPHGHVVARVGEPLRDPGAHRAEAGEPQAFNGVEHGAEPYTRRRRFNQTAWTGWSPSARKRCGVSESKTTESPGPSSSDSSPTSIRSVPVITNPYSLP